MFVTPCPAQKWQLTFHAGQAGSSALPLLPLSQPLRELRAGQGWSHSQAQGRGGAGGSCACGEGGAAQDGPGFRPAALGVPAPSPASRACAPGQCRVGSLHFSPLLPAPSPGSAVSGACPAPAACVEGHSVTPVLSQDPVRDLECHLRLVRWEGPGLCTRVPGRTLLSAPGWTAGVPPAVSSNSVRVAGKCQDTLLPHHPGPGQRALGCLGWRPASW